MAGSTEDSSGQSSSRAGAAEQQPSPMPSRTGSAANLGASAAGLRPTASVRRLRPHSSLAGIGGSRQASLVDFSGDHFSFGDIHGSITGVVQHDYLNRGKGVYEQERQRLRLPALVETGRHAGRSRVEYTGAGIHFHLLKRDFFITMLQLPFGAMAAVFAAIYLASYFFFGFIWWLLVRFHPGCVYGATTFAESWTLAIVTQMTIGYGNSGPQQCWAAAAVITAQAITCTVILNAVVLGIILAKVAQPAHRAFSIYISDTAVIARRDGILKLLFRVADVRRTQVIEPRVKAFLYTWGEGRVTAEGEYIPVRCEQLDLAYIDGMLLLPLIIEHVIDERSPLCGHTHDSLSAMHAEIVVTFEATTEAGNPFFARQSYLAQEINWGCKFEEIIMPPRAEEEAPRYRIDLDRFHDVRCPELELSEEEEAEDLRSKASQLVVNRAKRTVPYPLLGENTLVISDVLCVRPVEGERGSSRMQLVCRVADTYPSQMLEVTARIFLYRWRPAEWCREHPDRPPFQLRQLDCGYSSGADRLYLRLPFEVVHTIDASSPLAGWLEPGGLSEDADSEIVVVLQGYLHQTGTNRMRQRTFRVGSHVRYGFRFAPAVKHPAECRDGKPRVRWAHFFDVEPVGWSEGGGGKPTVHLHSSAMNNPALRAYLQRRTHLSAPESHAQVRAQQDRSPHLNRALDKPLSRSLRWVPVDPDAVASAAAVRRQSLRGPAAAVAAAEAVQAVDAERAEQQAQQQAAAAAAAAAAPALMSTAATAGIAGRASTFESPPEAPLDRYESNLARLTALSPGTAAEAGEEQRRRQQQQQQLGEPPPAQQAAFPVRPPSPVQQQRHLTGPPNLAMLSATPSVGLDRYDAALTRLSAVSAGDASPLRAGSAGSSTFETARSAGASSYGTARTAGSPFDTAPSSRSLPEVAPTAQGPLSQPQLRRPSPRFEPQPDLLISDLTATPSVPLERYAAMVAGEGEEEEAAVGRWPAHGGRGGGGAAQPEAAEAQAAAQHGATHPPRQQPRPLAALGGRPPRPGIPITAPAGGSAEMGPQVQQDASWHKRRSLANLAAILEAEKEEEERERERWSRPGSPGPAG
ncbi:hypothetical protein ABPG75_011177 [Micractinium tetrahymenae]